MFRREIIRSIFVLITAATVAGAASQSTITDINRLAAIEAQAKADYAALRGSAYVALRDKAVGPMARLLADPNLDLIGVLPSGRPLFYSTNNLDAAVSVSTDVVWPGGWTGLNLTGANSIGSMAIWDGDQVRTSHQEFQGRVTVGDGGGTLSDHSTHVAGTIVASGINPQAIGMSYTASLVSYDWLSDTSEMAAAAAGGLFLSNHSYGATTGWGYGFGGINEWFWFGDTNLSEVEDANFGFYNSDAAAWDDIAHAAPYYLIVKSAGNDRDNAGPGPGGGHYFLDDGTGDWAWSTTTRDPDGGLDGFDTIPTTGVAKNILTVGAVLDVPGGWSMPGDVIMSSFSSWGPSDDGRIKPDLVANGVDLYSSTATSDDSYAYYSGTSMSAPSVTGSLNLLAQQYEALHNQPLLASSLKAIVLHSASEAGPAPGPDYMFGWGLLNTVAAGLLIADDANGGERLREATISNGTVDTYQLYYDGSDALKLTLVWTDPAGATPPLSLNPTTPMLVNDLDLRLIRESDDEVFYPWGLVPTSPAGWATTGPNHRDNVEIIDASGASEGTYLVEVSHTGDITGNQTYSLVQSGLQKPMVVMNVQVEQRQFTALVDVSYDLRTASDQPVTVSLFLSTDSGASYPHLCQHVSGDVGAGIMPGTALHIVWDAGQEYPGFSSTTCRLRVTADDAANMDDFVFITPGAFTMGSPSNEPGRYGNETQHMVTLTHGIYVQSTEVTNQQYMEMSQWAYDHGYVTATSDQLYDNLDGSTQMLKLLGSDNFEISFSNSVFSCTNPDHPVKYMSWYGAAAYCDWLSLQQGLPRVYNHGTWQCNGGNPYTTSGYRLPTEAEWEYVCRAGNATAFANGPITQVDCSPVDPNLTQMGWYCGNAGGWTHPVAQKLANAWGLYDMHGNQWEWCWDGYRIDYQNLSPTDPECSVGWRMLRGGSWDWGARYCRSALRGIDDPVNSDYNYGFRPVRSSD